MPLTSSRWPAVCKPARTRFERCRIRTGRPSASSSWAAGGSLAATWSADEAQLAAAAATFEQLGATPALARLTAVREAGGALRSSDASPGRGQPA